MSHDTQVKQEDKVPERVWLTVFEDDQDPQSTMLEWRSPVVRNTQPGDYVSTRPHHKIAYVPESLLATVRREAFKEAVRIARDAAWTTKNHDVGAHDLEECATCAAAMQSNEIVAALEASATEKGNDGKA